MFKPVKGLENLFEEYEPWRLVTPIFETDIAVQLLSQSIDQVRPALYRFDQVNFAEGAIANISPRLRKQIDSVWLEEVARAKSATPPMSLHNGLLIRIGYLNSDSEGFCLSVAETSYKEWIGTGHYRGSLLRGRRDI